MTSPFKYLPALETMEHHPTAKKLVEIIINKTQNDNPLFFHVLIGYYFSVMAASMRCKVSTAMRGKLPINMYSLILSPSGTGKGHSMNIMEDHVIHHFRRIFQEETFLLSAETNLPKIATDRARKKAEDPDAELAKVEREFAQLGPYLFSFDSGTPAAVKQMRQKLLLADAGAMNLQIDEIGSNLLSNTDVLGTYLELFDVGKIKQKLVKNTADNGRSEEIHGSTPTNMLLLGTPSKLLNGGKQEEELYAMLETGYARRCFFAYAKKSQKQIITDPEKILEIMTDTSSEQFLEDISLHFGRLANYLNFNKTIDLPRDINLALIEYETYCKQRASRLPEHDEIRKSEMEHRYFKVLKLAAAYAFVDEVPEVLPEHLHAAIRLAEDAGEAFDQLLTRDQPYIKLAKYIADVRRPLTQAELLQDLPFFKGSQSQRTEMLQLATAWGYQNSIILKKIYQDGVDFYSGEALQETDLTSLIVSHSPDLVQGFQPESAPIDQLHLLTQNNNYNWSNHHYRQQYRTEDGAIPGFNLVVIDVDDGITIDMAQNLLKEYTYHMYTTKSHTPDHHRFRIVMPINYILKLDSADFKEFMHNIFSWLPFEVDTATAHRSRKWASWNGQYWNNDGQLLDALPFIPKTSKSEERRIQLESQQHMDNLERWVLNNTGDGNRNQMLLRYALILVDAGKNFNEINNAVMGLNDKLADKLEQSEILATIMTTVSKKLGSKP